MLFAYQSQAGRLTQMAPQNDLAQALWVDLYRPLPDQVAEVARLGLVRSFQISAVFPHLSVLENVRVSLQRQRGGSFDFWRPDSLLRKFDDRAMELLEDVGLDVVLASDGQQAVDMARHQAFSLILMDMQMPMLGGVEAAQRIRQWAGGKQVPILAVTANVFTEDRDQCLAAGMNDFITKPVQPAALFETLLKWLDWHDGQRTEGVPAKA